MVLTPVSCYYMTSFNYGRKTAKDVGFTCRCHLSDIMPDSIFYDSMGCGTNSIFYDSMGWGITFFSFFFCMDDNYCLPQHQIGAFSCLTIITPMDLKKP